MLDEAKIGIPACRGQRDKHDAQMRGDQLEVDAADGNPHGVGVHHDVK